MFPMAVLVIAKHVDTMTVLFRPECLAVAMLLPRCKSARTEDGLGQAIKQYL